MTIEATVMENPWEEFQSRSEPITKEGARVR